MQKRILYASFLLVVVTVFFNWSCTKFDTTNIGGDVLPAVDNINTFADTLSVNATQALFGDSTKIGRADLHVLGKVNNDPLFGTTQANVYLQLKPSSYPFAFGSTGDTLNGFGAGLDSVVLCLKYTGFWGDSSVLQHLEVREVSNNNGLWDSIYQAKKISFLPNTKSTILGSADVDVRSLPNLVKFANGKDSSTNQIRIKLSSAFANALYARDSLPNGAFRSDSLYKTFYNGLAIVASGGGNGLMYCNLTNTDTRLEIHFKKRNNGKLDTIYQTFKLSTADNGVTTPSSSTNYVSRNRGGYPVLSPAATEIYLQSTPGTYANLKIPAFDTMSNKIIHRAELVVQQIYNSPLDAVLKAPGFLYLDIKDTSVTNRWKPIYYDLNPSSYYNPDLANPYWPSNGIDFAYFGGFRSNKIDYLGNSTNYYTFNITRHLQQIVTKHTPNYEFRLSTPYEIIYQQYYPYDVVPYNNSLAYGRVKVGSGTNSKYRMYVRIVYSKI